MDGAATARGVRAGGGAAVSDSGPTPSLWRAIFASGPDIGHPRGGYFASLAVAEPVCRASDSSIRRECLDPVVVISERHLRDILSKDMDYYNRPRTHLFLHKA